MFQEVLYGTLQALSSDGRLYCTGEHYFVAVPSMIMYANAENNANSANAMAPPPCPPSWSDAAPYYMGVGPAKPPAR